MSESSYYCPLSGRFSNSELPIFNAVDVPIERLAERQHSAEELAQEVDERIGAYLETASDALFDAFESASGTTLVSRQAFTAEDLVDICAELSAAAGRRALSGVVRSYVTTDGYVVVVLSYVPEPVAVSEAAEVSELFDELDKLHAAGLLHGGINERFVNARAEAGRKLFGVGLSHAYAAWRREQGLELAGMRADPRFAAPELIDATLRGEVNDDVLARADRFALATVILTEIQPPGSPGPAMDAVNGVNALMLRAARRDAWAELCDSVGDKKSADLLRNAVESSVSSTDQRLWYFVAIGALALILLMQLWMVTRPGGAENGDDGQSDEVQQRNGQAQAIQCSGEGLRVVRGQCVLDEGYARCGPGTRLQTESGECVTDNEDNPEEREERAAGGDEAADPLTANVGGTYIHPVLTCEEGVGRRGENFAFTDDDINFTQGEKYTLQRLTNGCEGVASIIYYTSDPNLEERAQTIFNEFRSSSSCNDGCRSVMPETPTAVVYVPYIGMLERSNRHYMFFHCCVPD